MKEMEKKRTGTDMNWYFKPVFDYLRRDDWPALTGKGFMVWTALWAKSVPMTGIAEASHEQLRRMTKLGSKNTVQRAMAELIEKGYIARIEVAHYGSQEPWTYRMLLRPEADDPKLRILEERMVRILMEGEMALVKSGAPDRGRSPLRPRPDTRETAAGHPSDRGRSPTGPRPVTPETDLEAPR